MNRKLAFLVVLILALSCDSTGTNKRKLAGEWVIDSIETRVPVNHLLQINSHLVFDARLRFGLFLPNTTNRDLLSTYSVSNDKLTVWLSDQGLVYKIEEITDSSLILREITVAPQERFRIFLRKAD